MIEVDVLVVGGGPAGCTTAAAMGQLGLRTLLADAGQDRRKLLAGELLHPVGVEELTAFGFSEVLRSGGVPIVGFAVVDKEKTALLPYGPGNRGLGIEHHALIARCWTSSRSAATSRCVAGPGSTCSRTGRTAWRPRCPTRDTPSACVPACWWPRTAAPRRSAGRWASPSGTNRLSTMVGVLVAADTLPHPDRGHLFIGGPAPVLAYPISGTHARVMVDLPLGSTPDRVRTEPDILSGVPRAAPGHPRCAPA